MITVSGLTAHKSSNISILFKNLWFPFTAKPDTPFCFLHIASKIYRDWWKRISFLDHVQAKKSSWTESYFVHSAFMWNIIRCIPGAEGVQVIGAILNGLAVTMSQHSTSFSKTLNLVCSCICSQSDSVSKHWVEIFAAPERLIRSHLAAEVATKCLRKTVITDFNLQQQTKWAQWDLRDQTPVTKMFSEGPEALCLLASLGQKIMASYKEFVSGESHYFWSWYLKKAQ